MTEVTTASILRDTHRRLRSRGVGNPTVERVTHGGKTVFVSYDDPERGVLPGLAHAPADSFPPIQGMLAEAVLDTALDTDPRPETRALGVATLNALSRGHVDWESGDPMEALTSAVETVGMVGLFRPAFGKFSDVDIRVVERYPDDVTPPSDLPHGVSVNLFGPTAASAAFEDASVIFITGSTLVYGGIGDYLTAAPEAATVVIIGSSSSFIPTALFEAGVDLVAGATVTDVGTVERLVGEGATVPELHSNGLQKGIVRNEGDPLQGIEDG